MKNLKLSLIFLATLGIVVGAVWLTMGGSSSTSTKLDSEQKQENELVKKVLAYSDTLKTLEFSFEEFLPKVKTLLDSCKEDNTETFCTLQTQYETMQAIHNELKKCKDKNLTHEILQRIIPANLATYLNESSGLTDEQCMILDSLIHKNPQGYKDTYLANFYHAPMNTFSDIRMILQIGQKGKNKGKNKGKSLTDKGNQKAF